jgi:hypothetical protein
MSGEPVFVTARHPIEELIGRAHLAATVVLLSVREGCDLTGWEALEMAVPLISAEDGRAAAQSPEVTSAAAPEERSPTAEELAQLADQLRVSLEAVERQRAAAAAQARAAAPPLDGPPPPKAGPPRKKRGAARA